MERERHTDSTQYTWIAPLFFTLAFALMIVVAAAILLPACGVRLPFSRPLDWCPRLANEIAYRDDDTLVLKTRIAALEAEFKERSCAQPSDMADIPVMPVEQTDEPACRVDPGHSNTVLIIDGSSSMLVPLDVDKVLEERLMRASPLNFVAQAQLESLKSLPGEKRITAAKAAAAKLLGQIPQSRRRAITFSGCDAISAYTGNDTLPGVAGIVPDGGTPIAKSLLAAAAMLDDGIAGTITLVTDGGESCDGDICAVARSIKDRVGGTVINVIDLAGWTEIGCVDEITGGQHVSYDSGMDLSAVVETQALSEPLCEN